MGLNEKEQHMGDVKVGSDEEVKLVTGKCVWATIDAMIAAQERTGQLTIGLGDGVVVKMAIFLDVEDAEDG